MPLWKQAQVECVVAALHSVGKALVLVMYVVEPPETEELVLVEAM